MSLRAIPTWLSSVLGVLAILLVWWVAAAISAATATGNFVPIPTPWSVVTSSIADGFGFFWTSFSVTLTEAGIGYFWGNLIALLLSAFVLVVPRVEGILQQLAVVSYCVPIVAIGPIALLILGGADAPGDPSSTAVFLAGLSVFFTTVVGAILGFKAADKASLDVITVYGGSRLTQLYKVRLIAALPGILNALQIAVPAAFLGAILGEYFGKIEVGVGPILRNAAVSLNSPRVFALFLLCALVSLLGYALVGLIGRLIAPWSTGRQA